MPACDVAIVGFTDNHIWIGCNPRPFGLDDQPRAAFFGIRAALLGC